MEKSKRTLSFNGRRGVESSPTKFSPFLRKTPKAIRAIRKTETSSKIRTLDFFFSKLKNANEVTTLCHIPRSDTLRIGACTCPATNTQNMSRLFGQNYRRWFPPNHSSSLSFMVLKQDARKRQGVGGNCYDRRALLYTLNGK